MSPMEKEKGVPSVFWHNQYLYSVEAVVCSLWGKKSYSQLSEGWTILRQAENKMLKLLP